MKIEISSLRVRPRTTARKPQFHIPWAETAVLAMLLSGLALMTSEAFPSVGLPWWGIFLFEIIIGFGLMLLYNTIAGKWILVGGVALTGILCLIFHDPILSGLSCLGNDAFELLTQKTGDILLDFEAADSSYVLWGLLPPLFICILLLSRSVWSGQFGLSMIVLLPIFVAIIVGLLPAVLGCGLLVLGMVMLLMQRTGTITKGFPTHLGAVAICIVFCLLIGMLFGDSLNTNGADSIQKMLHNALHHGDNVSMPEGELKNLKRLNKSETPALEIAMEQPGKVYLRGKIYEVYTGNAWESLDTQDQAEYESLFYWLHDSGFYGQSQIGYASRFTSQVAPLTMSVRSLNACDAHGYYPYAVYGSGTLDAERIGDSELNQATTLYYLTGSVPEWYGVQQALAGFQNRDNIAEYLTLEQAYAEYVTAVDLQMTNESWAVLDRQLGGDDSGKTLSEIRDIIRTYLGETLTYDESVRTLNGSGDFLQYTLEKSGSGYSVHYATAAVLMLRYFGVPARYVEGYFLSADEAASYDAGETIVLTEEHAHAWAEYYLNGVGFVPFEVTPGYIDNEEFELGGGGSMEQTYDGNQLKFAQVQQPEKIEEPEQDRFTFSMNPLWLLALIPILPIWLILLIVFKRRKFNAAMKEIDEAENRDAIAMRYGYATHLLDHSMVSAPEGADAAMLLNREALFSNHEMTSLQRQQMDDYASLVLKVCKASWTWLQKLRYRLWDCLY